MPDSVTRVDVAGWYDAAAAAAAGRHYDWLGACDEGDDLRVVVRFVDPATGAGLRLEALVPDGTALPSLRAVAAGAAWDEREAHDLFGLAVEGGDDRPLYEVTGTPLRKNVPLEPRLTIPWPGFAGAEVGRRRQAPPGVPDQRERRRR